MIKHNTLINFNSNILTECLFQENIDKNWRNSEYNNTTSNLLLVAACVGHKDRSLPRKSIHFQANGSCKLQKSDVPVFSDTHTSNDICLS